MHHRIDPVIEQLSAGLQHSDPPEHTRIHKRVNRSLAPTVVNRMQDQIQSFVDALLAPVLRTGRIDLIHDFAEPLPVRVLGHVLGFTPEECEQFRRWDDDFVAVTGTRSGTPEAIEQARRSADAQIAWLEKVTARRRNEPRDDLFGALVQGLDAGHLQNLPELQGTYLSTLIGGTRRPRG